MKYCLCLILLCITIMMSGQETMVAKTIEPLDKICATAPPTSQEIKARIADASNKNFSLLQTTTYIPIRAFIVRQSDGTGGLSKENLNKSLSYLNYHYADASIVYFYCDVTYIDNTAYYNYNSTQEDALCSPYEVNDAINVFFVNDITVGTFGACGYAYRPTTSQNYTLRVLMDNECAYTYDNGTYPHEMGHFFNLLHTHQGTEGGPTSANAENVPRTGPQANCDTNGDLICDTEADPRYDSNLFDIGSCSYTGSETDENGILYTPPVDNIMSYYPDACGGIFTPDQYAEISNGLAIRLSYSTYDLTGCTPPQVTDPSNVVASFNAVTLTIDIAWNDNSNNEEGFLIERADNGGPFKAVLGGGVANDVTNYSDGTIQANTTYQYRVRASNDNALDHALSSSVSVPLIYCRPTTTSGNCSVSGIGVGIAGVSLNGGNPAINNNPNGCQQDYTNYSSLSTEAAPGDNLTFSVFLTSSGGSYFEQNISWWIDKNQDGDFDDSGELLFQTDLQTSQSTTQKTGSLTIPVDASPGNTILRVRSRYYAHGPVSDPCGFINYSDTEDYTLIVTNTCVTNVSNPVASELMDALGCVNPGGTVGLTSAVANMTIDLGVDPLVFNQDVILEANPADHISILCSATSPGIQVSPGVTVELRGFNFIQHSSVQSAIENQGNLILQNMSVTNNQGQKVYNHNGATLIIEGNCDLSN